MKNILIALLIIVAAVSCSKKEDEPEPTPPPKNLQTFTFDTTAPFTVPIIDWTKDSKYVKANPPKEYHPSPKEGEGNNAGTGEVTFLYHKSLKFTSKDVTDCNMTYYFGKDDKLIGVMIKEYESNYPLSVSYFEKKLGKPSTDNSDGKTWEAKNITIGMDSGAAVYAEIALVKPSEVKFLRQEK